MKLLAILFGDLIMQLCQRIINFFMGGDKH
jgi:hypothetical protein